jgi:hypothetical protein
LSKSSSKYGLGIRIRNTGALSAKKSAEKTPFEQKLPFGLPEHLYSLKWQLFSPGLKTGKVPFQPLMKQNMDEKPAFQKRRLSAIFSSIFKDSTLLFTVTSTNVFYPPPPPRASG